MTEQEWCEIGRHRQGAEMVEHLCRIGRAKGEQGHRKLRLLACACGRSIWRHLTDGRSRRAIEISELYAEGSIDRTSLAAAGAQAREALIAARMERERLLEARLFGLQLGRCVDAVSAAEVALATTYEDHVVAAKKALEFSSGSARMSSHQQVQLLRDIFGNPFRRVSLDPIRITWNDSILPRIAQATYDECFLPTGRIDPSQLLILADALEEAGCTELDVLKHCRRPGEHVRGCWVVDLILGKE